MIHLFSLSFQLVDGDKGRALQGRGGFRNDNFSRGRGSFSRGRGYGRSDFDRRSDYSSRNVHSEGGALNSEYHTGLGKAPRHVVKD